MKDVDVGIADKRFHHLVSTFLACDHEVGDVVLVMKGVPLES